MAKKTNDAGGGAGGGISSDFLISKVTVAPSRKIGLENYSSINLSAGMEVVFATPVPVGSPLIQEAFDRVHKVLQEEFRKQLDLFGKKKEKTE